MGKEAAMDDFHSLLARDFGLKSQGKSAPMAHPRNLPSDGFSTFPSSPSFGVGSSAPDFTRSCTSTGKKSGSTPVFDDHDRGGDDLLFNDVFGGQLKYGFSDSRARPPPSAPAFDYDAVFKDQNISKSASLPVYDKPVYDEDIFEGVSGLKSSSTSAFSGYNDVFASVPPSPPKHKKQDSSPCGDLLGNFGRKDTEPKKTERAREDTSVFDDLIPGFDRSSSPPPNRSTLEKSRSHKASSETTKTVSNVTEDPFVVFESSNPAVPSSGVFSDPLEEIRKFSSTGSRNHSSLHGGVFDYLDPFDSLGKSAPEINKRGQDRSHVRTGSMNGAQSPVESFESHSPRKVPVDDILESHHTPSVSVPQTSSPTYVNPSPNEVNSPVNKPSSANENFDIWLSVSEIPLFTQPTSAPPPSRPPPPRPTRPLKKKVNEPSFSGSTQSSYSPRSARAFARSSVTSHIDELEDFAMGKTRSSSANGYPEVSSGKDSDANSASAGSAAAMKEAMDKAEAKFRHAREMREKEYMKTARSKEGLQTENGDFHQKELREKQERLERERLEKEKERERERARMEREREQRRLDKERIQRERELARQAVERATREARDRAAAEAHAKAQRIAVEKAAAEARERVERAAVQRAQAEARERAAADARKKAERAAAEAREKAKRVNAEAREREAREARVRTERAAVERAASEARERVAAEARKRSAAQARANQQRNENDLESFFSMGSSRPSSAPRQRANSSDTLFDTQNKGRSFESARTSSGAASNIRKASSTTNFVDDISSIFGVAASQSDELQEVEGESEERRRARLERHQRTQERAAKALAEKKERDLQAQREQAERHRNAETLDLEIKRWAAGKEGNLRALLSTLQYVLWPGCGWQPVSLTDLITAASVKKVYRKATLCIHPDKVQQKGANLQQKYIAEKVFDLLKEAWNKFNSEELF